jgi:hypothetical protein
VLPFPEAQLPFIPAQTQPNLFIIFPEYRVIYICFSQCINANNPLTNYLTEWSQTFPALGHITCRDTLFLCNAE